MRRLKPKRILLAVIFLVLLYCFHIIFSSVKETIQEDDIDQLIKSQRQPIFPKKPQNKNLEVNKKDWHDLKQIFEEKQRTGPGEQGAAVHLSNDEIQTKEYKKLMSKNGFNGLASDKISLKRSMKDLRHPLCHKKFYLKKLPTVSVIIPFHNEHLSALLRTVHSIVLRTPPELLNEIILVDDYSNLDFLNNELEDYIRKNFEANLVKIIRNKKREGLIRTRLAGSDISQAEVLIFFDSHIECNSNWLPPLIEPIALDEKICVCPFIDVISDKTFEITAQDEGARGAFDWEFYYKRLPLVQITKDPTIPFDNPVMAGGLFAISKKWFYHLGGYDKGLEVWGGEQYELSFKIWQCGGKIVDAPCSRVAHIYRSHNPNGMAGDYLSKNYKRVAEVWMDDYKKFIYKKRPHMQNLEVDISKQLAIREKLNCKPFKWYMENVAFDLVKYYPPVPPLPLANGKIMNKKTNLCIAAEIPSKVTISDCSSRGRRTFNNFEFTIHHDIQFSKHCFDISTSSVGDPVGLFACHSTKGNQEFAYDLKSSHIFHVASRQCIDSDSEKVFINKCNKNEESQMWQFDHMNKTEIINRFSASYLNY